MNPAPRADPSAEPAPPNRFGARSLWYSVLAVVSLLGFLAIVNSLRQSSTWDPPATFDEDLDHHPLYSAYELSDAEDVIDIGSQPLLFPTGLISESMKRDRVLWRGAKESGVQVRFHPFLKGRDINHFLHGGKLEAGIGGDTPTLTAISKLDAVAPVVIQKGFLSIVGLDPMLVSELAGLRIGYPKPVLVTNLSRNHQGKEEASAAPKCWRGFMS